MESIIKKDEIKEESDDRQTNPFLINKYNSKIIFENDDLPPESSNLLSCNKLIFSKRNFKNLKLEKNKIEVENFIISDKLIISGIQNTGEENNIKDDKILTNINKDPTLPEITSTNPYSFLSNLNKSHKKVLLKNNFNLKIKHKILEDDPKIITKNE